MCPVLKTALSRTNTLTHNLCKERYTLRNKNARKVVLLLIKIVSPRSNSNMEPLNQNANEQEITER
jgi:hypothetical protein